MVVLNSHFCSQRNRSDVEVSTIMNAQQTKSKTKLTKERSNRQTVERKLNKCIERTSRGQKSKKKKTKHLISP